MYPDDERESEAEELEPGSDEVLAQDDLQLPEGASVLVQLHAVRAWLKRRQEEARLALGNAALLLLEPPQEAPPLERRARRRERGADDDPQARALLEAQERLDTYEEAETLLTETLDHTTGQRVLVEYYLTLEAQLNEDEASTSPTARQQILAEVQRRIERITAPPLDD
jgi:hypothetical protein